MIRDMIHETRRNAVLYAVQRAIFCPVTGHVLDIDDAYLITENNRKGCSVLSGNAWRKVAEGLKKSADEIEVWTGAGDELGVIDELWQPKEDTDAS